MTTTTSRPGSGPATIRQQHLGGGRGDRAVTKNGDETGQDAAGTGTGATNQEHEP
ncbi:hypothetical protein KIN20_031825 [Parelaphostrongylus tenuis]|uniref:Uncharacterized protein n=1 Tax=Parelaphostrongylus tenuis TaxID=148309 RepID=A0AAD5WHK2_PARTN|nr:hypothetical protein KIN20_015877 [Parelaphostrongylus tenuis]KAJ1370161.1 hypothetical protein KIN20_031825 [Parelaphostrongylus tenuis]